MNIFFAGIIGLVGAWLVNYLSDILPLRHQLTTPVCVHCHNELTWPDYLKLAKCPHCSKPRPWRTYLVFVAGIVASIWTWLFPPTMGFWLGMLVLAYFGVVIVIDTEHHLILNIVSLVGGALGLAAGILMHGFLRTLIGGATGLLIMLLFYWLGTFFARYRAKKMGGDDGEEALGFGDVTLTTVLGLMLGWPLILTGLLFGILAGGVVSLLVIVALALNKRYEAMMTFTAYGPYLVFGAFILLYFPQALTVLSGR